MDWLAEYPCLPPNSLEYDKIAVDEADNVYLFGSAGSSMSPVLYATAILTLKFDSTGNLLWENKFDNYFQDYFHDGVLTLDDGVLVAGWRGSLPGSDPSRAELVKYDELTGEKIWQSFIFDTVSVKASLFDVDFDLSGDIYGFGRYNQYPEEYDSSKMYVAKVSLASGEVLWTKIYNDKFYATKGKVLSDRVRVFGGKQLNTFEYVPILADVDFGGNPISEESISLGYEIVGPQVFNTYFFFDEKGYLVTFGYNVCKYEVAEDPVWCYNVAQGFPSTIGQAMTAVTDAEGNVYATGYLRDTLTESESTLILKLSPQGELLWLSTSKYSEDIPVERGKRIAISDQYTFSCSEVWDYDKDGNLENLDYRLFLCSNEDGSILYDTLIDGNLYDIPFYAHYANGHFYFLGRSYNPSAGSQSYKYKLFKFRLEGSLGTDGEGELKSPVNIYPNPAGDFIVITQSPEMEYKKASLFDGNGRLVLSEFPIDQTLKKIKLPMLPDGVYLLKLMGKNGVYTKKLVINSSN
ncbi:MAG: hypothetical protein Kow0027_29320 [Saprospiraceae bacterium]